MGINKNIKKIKTALISVSDKTNLKPLLETLKKEEKELQLLLKGLYVGIGMAF